MIRLAFLGGGGHSQGNHLPALRHYQSNYPNHVELCAFCDLDADTAKRTASEYGFNKCFTDLTAMLDSQPFDACIAITPVGSTAEVAMTVMRRAIPLLMEKPLGATLEQSRQVCDLAEQFQSRVMVSMNRRFDPALKAACAWRDQRPLHYLHVRMLRNDRRETNFITETAIHCVDAARHLAGEFQSYDIQVKQVDSVRWYHVNVQYVSGARGVIDIFPTCGMQSESYEIYGADYYAIARVAEFDEGSFTVNEKGRSFSTGNLPTPNEPLFIRNGTYSETEAFLSANRADAAFFPTPRQVWPSVQLCFEMTHFRG